MTVELRPLGVACNIACHYCYQNPQREAGNFRQSYQMERMKAAVSREGGPFTLFGGEPLLLPLADLEELFRWGRETYGRSGIQTNGILLNDEHLRLFQTYNVDVGVSIDGPDELNDLRWHVNLERTRRNTDCVLANIERLCREHRPPGLIVTLHRGNATADTLPRLHAWVRQMDALGIRSMRLHLLEIENEAVRQAYSLSDAENVQALLSFADLQEELTELRFDVLDEMEQSLLGRDQHVSCVWRACDPYTTEAVHGVEGNGQASNCGRTNKDGIDFIKAERANYARYLALYQTPQQAGGCQGCRFFLLCKGQCPGTALHGDWRNRSELCEVWKQVFSHLEHKLLQHKQVPLSVHPLRTRLEQRMLAHWTHGRNSSLQRVLGELASTQQPADPGGPETGAAHLPSFVRHTFVGEAQRAQWEPRFAAVRAALVRLGVLAVSRGIVPLSLVSVTPAEVFAIHNLAATHRLHARLLSRCAQSMREWMVIGGEQRSAQYRQAWAQGEDAHLDELAGVPLCCQQAHRHTREMGRDTAGWPLLTEQQAAGGPGVDVQYPLTLNTLFRPLGLDLPGYQPCGPQCTESQHRGGALLALGRETGMSEAMDWLTEILDWPAEWSALHGIGELKTGIIKLAYNTSFTPEKLTVRYHGHTLASAAARGLSFAYRQPQPGRRQKRERLAEGEKA
ncbi:MAG TPA: radical SAM protein [Ktedonobacteraceae bacterium]|jgi:uncharacterized protein